ncbi:hypothetical protein [Arthrobacter sp. UYCu512]|uniref:hypothetical protein n=1 Tax=Arthrobacter sp. UYCu512 TaxID=3156338 RepID=UPI003397E49B
MQGTKNGEVVGIASRTKERAREFANKHCISRVFESYEALLASPGHRRCIHSAAERASPRVDSKILGRRQARPL